MANANAPSSFSKTLVQGREPSPELDAGDTAEAAPIPDDLDDEPDDALTGELLLDRYRVVRRLGEGGMGTVYLAEHVTIKKRCAIKVLSQEYANKADLIDRFLQEARAASMIAHENVVEITDFGKTNDNSVFFVMEYLAGEDLSRTLAREGPLSWARVRGMALQICRALGAAHDKGIIHRDMKPENCFRVERSTTRDFIKVLDFGIAKVTTEDGDGGKGLTKTGMIFGTPEYMSPEQAQGIRVDHRADIYAVGVIMYELLTGQVPFTADSFMGILTQHMFEAPKSPRAIQASIPDEVERIILKAMQKDRDLRFQDMRAFITAIEAVGTGTGGVEVIAETLSRPPEAGKEMSFTDVPERTSATLPDGSGNMGTGPVAVVTSTEAGSRTGVIAMVVAALIVGVGGALIYLSVTGDEPETPETKQVVAEPEPQRPPKKRAKARPIVGESVHIKIKTNVPAEILDGRDRGSVGYTNEDGGVEVKKTDDVIKLILVAEGHDELEVELVPDREGKEFTYTLTPAAAIAETTGDPVDETTGDEEPVSEPKKKVTKKKVTKKKGDTKGETKDGTTGGGSVVPSSELKNPFGKRN
ncbi:MAG: serine/threonine-protein kinase [Nannocystaceae bacterium]|nr:serine/threonine protein kinase [Myxococcales bacterium]